jgi:murein DD-endopeptidase MepM/ murein hydrolase activator NlpD
MSQLSHSPYEYGARGHQSPARSQSAATVSQHLNNKPRGSDYTLVHAGRQVRIGPVAFWIVVGTLVVMGVWSIATGSYFAFSNDVLTRLVARQAEMQFAYEDRIAELRGQVDRITSRQLLDQEQFEQKLTSLMQRQATLEQRTATLSGDVTTTGSIKPARMAPPEAPQKPVKARPISDTVIFVAPPDREARLQSREIAGPATRLAERGNAGGLEGILSRVAGALDKVERKQTATLTDMEEKIDTKARQMRSVLADLGVETGKGGGVGGPYIPFKAPSSGASAFERQLYRINVGKAQVSQYSQTLVTVPVRKPIYGEIDMSSPFGMRMDPFMRGPAIHAGIDMRGDKGDPVRVTANGTVTIAAWSGGYGNMIEVDHGNGFATRYGHLSKIDVKVGQRVSIGQTIGEIGSTGRSTGPHLHYETRIDGEAVDPQKFLRAGLRLGSGVLGDKI